MSDKIRPRTHSSNSEASIRREAESGLSERARMPDPGQVPEGAIDATDGAAQPAQLWPVIPPGANFTPAQTAEFRRDQNDPNRLGLPPAQRQGSPEALLHEYQTAERLMKEAYAGTRDLSGQERYLKAKAAMIDAGLMKGDV